MRSNELNKLHMIKSRDIKKNKLEKKNSLYIHWCECQASDGVYVSDALDF